MKILDAKIVNTILLKHKKNLESVECAINREGTQMDLLISIEKAAKTVETLDGSELDSLKSKLCVVYKRALQWQVAEKEAQNVLLSTGFVVRLYEQELLSVLELRTNLPESFIQLRLAVKKNDLLRVFTYLGGIIGAVMTPDELCETT